MPAVYSFVSRWRVPVAPQRAWDELERELLPGAGGDWWPGVTVPMPARRVEPGERIVLAVRSPLGYALRMRLEIVAVEPGRAIAAASDGDLRGSGRVTVAEDGDGASLTFHWDVETRRAWMNATAFALRPVFERAHGHVMRRGERGLRAQLAPRDGSEPRNAVNRRISAVLSPNDG